MALNPLSRNMAQPILGPRGTTPNQDLNALLAKMSMPGAPGTGLNSGMQAPTIPSMPLGAAPTAQAASQAGKQKLANALTQQAAGQLSQTGSPTGSAVGGAMQGLGLYGAMTGKSPMGMGVSKLKELMGPSPDMTFEEMDPTATAEAVNKLGDQITSRAGTGLDANVYPTAEGGVATDPSLGSGIGPFDAQTAMNQDQNALAQLMDPGQLEATMPGGEALADTTAMQGAEMGAEVAADAGMEMGGDMLAEVVMDTAAEEAAAAAAAELAAEAAAETAAGSTGYGLPLIGAYELAKLLGFKF